MATILADTGVNYVISAKDVSKAAIDSAVAGTKRVQTATERMANHTREHLQRYRGYYLAAAAAVTAVSYALEKIVMSAAETGDKFEKMSKRTGVASEELSALAYAAEISGTNIDTLEKGLRYMATSVLDVARGTGEAKLAYERLGISVVGADGRLKGTVPIMLEIADKLRAVQSETEKAGLVAQIFGARAGTQLLPLLREGSRGIEELMQKAKDLGIVISTEDAARAAEFTDRMTDMKALIKGISLTLGNDLIVNLLPIVEKFNDWVMANRKLINQKIPEYLDKAKTALSDIWNVVSYDPAIIEYGIIGLAIGGRKGAAIAAGLGHMKTWVENLSAALGMAAAGVVSFSDIAKANFKELEEIIERGEAAMARMEATSSYRGTITWPSENGTGAGTETPTVPEDNTLDIMSQRFQAIESLQLGHFQTMKGFEDEYNKVTVSNAIWLANRTQQIEKETVSYKQRSAQAQYATAVALGQALLNFAGVNSQAIFLITQAFDFARAIVCAHIAAAEALASPPGPPWTIPLSNAILTWGYWNAGMIAAQAVGQYAASGNSAASGLGSSLGSPYVAVESADTTSETETSGESAETSPRSISVNVNVYGNLVNDYDGLARDLVSAIRKAEKDGV